MKSFLQQAEFDVKFEWGLQGLQVLKPVTDVIIIVDVLSFSTCVDIATNNGAVIYPYSWKDDTAKEYADGIGAELAGFDRENNRCFNLSPASLVNIPRNTKLVLPSPNGSALSLATGKTLTLCGCLRNAKAVAKYAMRVCKTITVIAAGERWADNTLRPAVEDMIGAGAIISYLTGSRSPESNAALSAFLKIKDELSNVINACASGKELIERRFSVDVDLACEFNTSSNVPVLKEGAYIGLTVEQ
jgi:2-phosphosulfolactate phosphatase